MPLGPLFVLLAGGSMAGQIKSTAAASLVEGVSITVVQDDDGWGFHRWSTCNDGVLVLQPIDAHRTLRFSTPGRAVLFFRETYGRRLKAR